ncbi:MAG: D-galactarate dehydratase [Tranquillimonas sp.]
MSQTLALPAALALAAIVAGCVETTSPTVTAPAPAPVAVAAAPAAAPARPAPPPRVSQTTLPHDDGAQTPAQLDTTTPEERAAAAAGPQEGEERLGTTVASLGDPAETGLWIKTPLVTSTGTGRIENPATGKSALVELRPLDAADGAGSEVSLSAFRILGAPLIELPTLTVYAR